MAWEETGEEPHSNDPGAWMVFENGPAIVGLMAPECGLAAGLSTSPDAAPVKGPVATTAPPAAARTATAREHRQQTRLTQ